MKTWLVNKLLSLYDIMRKLYWIGKYKELRAQYQIHKSFRFNGERIHFYGKGILSIKENSYIGEFSKIQVDEGCSVSIGKGCQISHNVRMYTSTAIPDSDFSMKPVPKKKGDIIIGDYVWIGANVFINPGISIGDNAIIGANSVVTKNVMPNAIVGGVPAKLIRFKNVTI